VPVNGVKPHNKYSAMFAGGEKFMVNGIFYKFARDWASIYGGDAFVGL